MRKRIMKSLGMAFCCASMACCTQGKKVVSNETVDLDSGWRIQSSAKVKHSGKDLSAGIADLSEWYKADLPSTVMTSLVRNGVYKDPYFDRNLENIPTEQFVIPWWYVKSFELKDFNDFANTKVVFKGINYKANIWLNGEKIVSDKTIEGPFRIFELDITKYLKAKNTIALEVTPPHKDALTIGFVDWNPWAPDNNLGLWRGVELIRSGKVALSDVFVTSEVNLKTLREADLTIKAKLTNYTSKDVSGTVNGNIGDIKFSKKYALKANEVKLIEFKSSEYSQLHINNPKLWWPVNMGDPNLYDLKINVVADNKITDTEEVRFGIRQVEDYMTSTGHRGYKINGKKVLIKGGGWVDDVMLADSEEKVYNQIKYVKHMGLNTVRLEGFWGNNKAIYNAADEHGVLLMIGLSCHWEWQGYCGRPESQFMSIYTDHDNEMVARSFQDQVRWLNNHPSIFLWVYGSDKLPSPKLEKLLNKYVKEVDNSRPILATCKERWQEDDRLQISEISGAPGVKMLGPYAYEPPIYWYEDKRLGGAYGFNTETGPGPQVPPLESMKKMLPADKLWPLNDSWNYHCGRNQFKDLNLFLSFFNPRYGKATSAEEFCFKNQISNYEAMRPMFEAFTVNKSKDATGIIQWMLNSAWPETYWQLYDWYLQPNGAFYGAKKACQPLNLVYNYLDEDIYITNEYIKNFNNLTADIRVLDINSKVLFEKSVKFDVLENISKKIFNMPEIKGLTKTYFLDLKLKDGGRLVSDNFYWLSRKKDKLNYKKSDWYYTPSDQHADMTLLNSMPKTTVEFKHKFETVGKEQIATVVVKNTGNRIAFFIDLKVVGDKTGNSVLPVFWSDNYVSLLPGEEKTFTATFETKNLKGDNPRFEYKGYNLK